ncbi:MAG: Gldg family protein [Clostridiales Family XIII bacterium]|jgi:ABC-2 type transport system permease protein|nr:Gldg family protein [Clostridiales Family XIII bacterium]
MKAIIKREFLSHFRTITGWLYIAAGMALYGLFFFAINMSYGEPYMASSLGSVLLLGLITVPVLTMRTLAEERRSRTDQLLLTSPVPAGKVVAAKYIGCAAVHTISMASLCVAPAVMNLFGETPLEENYVAVLGFWLFGLCGIAVGVFASSLTESQLIAAVLTFGFLFVGYLMGGITQLISTSGNVLTKILSCYDLMTPLDSFFAGALSLTGALYYVSVAALFLFFATQAVQKRRWDKGVLTLRAGVFSTGLIAVAVGAAVGVNLLAAALPASAQSLDVTAGKIYTLTDETKGYLSGLEKDVTIHVIAAEETADVTVGSTLKDFEEASGRISVEYHDPLVSPTFYQTYSDSAVADGSLIVVCGEISRVVDYSALYVSEFDYTTYESTVTGYDAEGQIVSALQYVTSEERPKFYELTGHGEAALPAGFAGTVEKANFEAAQLTLLKEDAVPDDARAVLINGPTVDLSKDDAEKVAAYLERGGNVIVTFNYSAPDDLPNLEALLGAYGLAIAPGIVIEGDIGYYYQEPMYLLPEIGTDGYLTSLGQSYVLAPLSRGATHAAEAPDGVAYYTLLSSTASSYAKPNAMRATTLDYEEGDAEGPFDIGVVAEITIDAGVLSQLVVLGSDMILTDEVDGMVSGANAALLADILSNFVDLAGDGAAVVIPAKDYTISALTVPRAVALVVGGTYTAVAPLALLAIGLLVWLRRRRA